jgi:putative nucleotidyltransferase with HDIG domain
MPNLPPQHKEFLGLLIKIVSALESRRPYALGHSQRVADLAKAMAENLGLSGEEADQLYLAGLLHDIGYLVMPDEILHSSEPLTSQQREVVDSQLQVGLQILGSLSLLDEVRKIIRYHNNRFDGLGAPKEPNGHNLPLGSRILHAAHVFEALSSDRPHRKKMSYKGALLEMQHNQGRFDPVVLEALTEVLELDITDDLPDQVDLDEFTHWLDKIFKDAVAGRFAVPTVPCAMAVIRKLMRHDGSSLRQMSGIIELEPALALNIISTANSSLFYGMPPVHTVSDALVRIGLNEARNLMVTYVYRTLFRTDQLALHRTLQTWWEHSLLKASACKSLAGHLGMKNQNYAYLAGLLSDVGMPALLQVFIHRGQDRPLSDWQMEILFSRIENWHHQLGAELLKNAHLPLSLIEAVRQKGHGVFLKRNREALLLALSDEVLKHVLCETEQPDSNLQDLIAEHNLEMKHQDISQAFTATLRRYQALQGLLAATDTESIDRRTLLFDLKASHS